MISSNNLKLIDVADPKNLKSTIKGMTEKVEEIDGSTVKIVLISSPSTTSIQNYCGQGVKVFRFYQGGLYYDYFGVVKNYQGAIVFEFEEVATKHRFSGYYMSSASAPTFSQALSDDYSTPFALKSELGVQVVYDDEGYPCWEDED